MVFNGYLKCYIIEVLFFLLYWKRFFNNKFKKEEERNIMNYIWNKKY